MSANPTNEEIMGAIEQSGYLMEQHVATQIEALNFHITTNVAFEDPDEGKSREIDVSGIKRVAVNESAVIRSSGGHQGRHQASSVIRDGEPWYEVRNPHPLQFWASSGTESHGTK